MKVYEKVREYIVANGYKQCLSKLKSLVKTAETEWSGGDLK